LLGQLYAKSRLSTSAGNPTLLSFFRERARDQAAKPDEQRLCADAFLTLAPDGELRALAQEPVREAEFGLALQAHLQKRLPAEEPAFSRRVLQKHEGDWLLRLRALSSLSQAGDYPALLAAALKDPDPEVRRDALSTLNGLPATAERLADVESMLSDPDAKVQDAARYALLIKYLRPGGPLRQTVQSNLDKYEKSGAWGGWLAIRSAKAEKGGDRKRALALAKDAVSQLEARRQPYLPPVGADAPLLAEAKLRVARLAFAAGNKDEARTQAQGVLSDDALESLPVCADDESEWLEAACPTQPAGVQARAVLAKLGQ
jgi:hypothetical protein